MPRRFADLHCHPSMFGFNRLRHTAAEGDPAQFHPWHAPPEDAAAMRKGRRASAYAQADVAKLHEGRCRLVFASITPIERGFFTLPEARQQSFPAEALKLATGTTLIRSVVRRATDGSFEALHELTGILRNHGPVRTAVQMGYLRYGLTRIQYMQGPDFDYWDEFLREYDFWQNAAGQRTRTESSIIGPTEGCYHMPASPEALGAILDDEASDDVAILMTIEGAHTFSIDAHEQPHRPEIIFDRIRALKDLPSPIFFLTIAHHFDNGLCGHAHSIPDVGDLVLDQTWRMHEGLEPEGDLGYRAIRELLSLDEELQDTGAPRILIDCKHMSARSRKEYYARVVRPANARLQQDAPKIPVLFSHGAYAGVRTLDRMIQDAPREDDYWRSGPYYAWNLNCSDEDVRMVLETDGLIGLCLDQRVAGVLPRQKVHREQWSNILMNQVFGLVDAIMLDDTIPDADKIRIWDCICIGSDYDGLIDPMSAYPTALELDDLAEDLRRELHDARHTRMIAEVGVDAIVDKIAFENAHRFATAHMPYACR